MIRFFEKLYSESQTEFYRLLKNDLQQKRKRFIVTANPEAFMIGERDRDYAQLLLDDQTTVVADGIGLIKAANMLSLPIHERIPGVEIAEELMKLGNQFNSTIYLFGAKPEVIEAMKCLIQETYPHLRLCGYSDGYVADKEKVFQEMIRLQPDIVLDALGMPAQERLIYQHLDQFQHGILVGVGGSFDVLSGLKKRAPKLFIRCNLEWLYRLVCEPSRIKRFYHNNVKFIWQVRKMKSGGSL